MIPESCLIITFPPWALVVIGATIIVAATALWFVRLNNYNGVWWKVPIMFTTGCYVALVVGGFILIAGIAPYIPCIQFAVGGI